MSSTGITFAVLVCVAVALPGVHGMGPNSRDGELYRRDKEDDDPDLVISKGLAMKCLCRAGNALPETFYEQWDKCYAELDPSETRDNVSPHVWARVKKYGKPFNDSIRQKMCLHMKDYRESLHEVRESNFFLG